MQRKTSSDEDAHFFNLLLKHDILTRSEEAELFIRIAKGDKGARNVLIEKNMRLVSKIAEIYWNRSKRFGNERNFRKMDLVQQGVLGLSRAIDKFELDRGYKFSTYATNWVFQSISEFIQKNSSVIRSSKSTTDLMAKYKNVVNDLSHRLSRVPTSDEIRAELGISKDRMRLVEEVAKYVLSLDDVTESPNGSPSDLANNIPDKSEPVWKVVETLGTECLSETIRSALVFLGEQEREVISYYFGLNGRHLTLDEIGRHYGITKERVRQIKLSALKKLSNDFVLQDLDSQFSSE